MKIEVSERKGYSVIEVLNNDGQSFRIMATEKGLEITSIHDNGDLIVRPKTSNQVVLTVVPTVLI